MAKTDYSKDSLYRQSHKGFLKRFFLKIAGFVFLILFLASVIGFVVILKSELYDKYNKYRYVDATIMVGGTAIEYTWNVKGKDVTGSRHSILPRKKGSSIRVIVDPKDRAKEIKKAYNIKLMLGTFAVVCVTFLLMMYSFEYAKGD